MKKYIFNLALVSLLMSSCADWSMHQVERELKETDLSIQDARQFAYELDASDYASVSKNEENIALALSLDSDSVAYRALLAVSTNKCFSDEASADVYLPAFLKKLYPQLSVGAQGAITFRQNTGKTTYQKPFASSTAYNLTDEDYKTIWGGRGADYLAPTAEAKIPDFLSAKFPTAADSKIFVLTYRYSTEEPDTIYPPLPYECTVAQLLEAKETVEHQLSGVVGKVTSTLSGRFYLVDGNDSILVYGLTDEDGNRVWKDKGIQQGDFITVKGKYSGENTEPQLVGAVYVSHIPANTEAANRMPQRIVAAERVIANKTTIYQRQNGVWVLYTNDQVKGVEILPESVYEALGTTVVSDPATTINIYLKNKYPYAAEEDDYLVVYMVSGGSTADDFVFDGTDFVMVSGYGDEVMNFLLKKDKGWQADISTYLNEPFLGHGQGNFVLQNVLLSGPLTYVWKYDASYGMKASAYYGGNNAAEAWLVSPAIKLKKAKKPSLIFDMTQKYAANFAEECKVWVSTDYAGDVTACTWKQLPYLQNEDGTLNVPDGSSWTFQSSGEMLLTDYIEQKIWIGFQYTSSDAASATWEIKNLLVHEIEENAE